MKKLIATFIIVLLVITGCTVENQDTSSLKPVSNKELEKTAEIFTESHEKVSLKWDQIGFKGSFDDFNIIITNLNKAYLIEPNNNTIQSINYKALKKDFGDTVDEFLISGFDEIKYEGKDALIIGVGKRDTAQSEEEIYDAYELAMHELFHNKTQDNWESLKATTIDEDASRSTYYPVDDQQRILRISIYDKLTVALSTKNIEESNQLISEAAYLFDSWVNTFPDDAKKIKDTDIAEGTAEYFGKLVVRTAQGKEDDSDLLPTETYIQMVSTADTESYYLGDVSLRLLNKQGKFEEVDFNSTLLSPLDLLFMDVERLESEVDATRISTPISKEILEFNESIETTYKDLITQDRDGLLEYIGIPTESIQGSVTIGSMVRFKDIDKEGFLNFSMESSKIKIEEINIFADNTHLYIPISNVEIRDNKLYIKTEGISVNGVDFKKTNDRNGNILYIVN